MPTEKNKSVTSQYELRFLITFCNVQACIIVSHSNSPKGISLCEYCGRLLALSVLLNLKFVYLDLMFLLAIETDAKILVFFAIGQF